MKSSFVLFAFLVLSVVSSACADGKKDSTKQEVKWRTFDAGMTEAKQTGKKVLLDIYTDWCVWCKRLDQNVYSDPAVASYMTKYFVPVKLNAESDAKVHYKDSTYTSAAFAQGLGVTGYPTILFLDTKGDPIDRLGGYVEAPKFLPIIRFIGEDYFKKMSWEDFQKSPASAPVQK
jgi:thioredoxin-related protein